MRRATVLLGVFLLCLLAAAPAGAEPAVPQPDQDSFYTPPAGYESAANGTILRSRQVAATALSVPLSANSWQLLYKSLDTHDQPTATVATVLVPSTPWSGAGLRPLVSYQTAEDSVGTRCAPSYALRAGLAAASSNSALEAPLIASTLAKGWAVVTADYEGPHSEYGAGVQAGHAVLDGIRAAKAFTPSGLSAENPTALWGYSGGALASGWAAELQPAYAPELHFAGVALGGYPANPGAILPKLPGGPFSGLGLGALIGISRAYPEAKLDDLLNARGKQLFADNATACGTDLSKNAFLKTADFTDVPDPFDLPQFQKLNEENTLGKVVPQAPLYVYHAINDELVPFSSVRSVVQYYCAGGAKVDFLRAPLGGHIVLAVAGAPGAQSYLADRFAGKPIPNTC